MGPGRPDLRTPIRRFGPAEVLVTVIATEVHPIVTAAAGSLPPSRVRRLVRWNGSLAILHFVQFAVMLARPRPAP